MRVILVADHASIDFGGEAALPCHYFRVLSAREGIDVHLVVHERSRPFLQRHFADAGDRIHYARDTAAHRFIFHGFQKHLPDRIGYLTFGFLLRTLTQYQQRSIVTGLIVDKANTLVHQVIPVSPKAPSNMSGLGVPVMFGPLNGGMNYPQAFSHYEGGLSAKFNQVGRLFSNGLHYLFSGKRLADLILVANQRTARALPSCIRGEVKEIVENGVDLSLWSASVNTESSAVPAFVYVGRLVDWKAVDILLLAYFDACRQFGPMVLHIIGDGNERPKLEKMVAAHGDANAEVIFHGWVAQSDIAPILKGARALVLPSLYECGGAVVLEAMASGVAVIATNWGGPADYLDDHCGILVNPDSREALIAGFSQGLMILATNPDMAVAMGSAGRRKIEAEYDWEKKVDQVTALYHHLLEK